MFKQLPLLIPVENQVRELDPKLLLAVAATKAGFCSYIGYRTEMDIVISKLPRSIYLAKSFTQRSDKMFRILSKLGHIICAWDEEALVHYPPDIYFTRRLSENALRHVSHLFAWGKDNENLFREFPQFPDQLPIHLVGNPRLDLLRKEFGEFYQNEISRIRQQHGQFILINTNFGNVNAHLPYLNLFTDKDEQGNYLTMGRGATGMNREYAEGRAKFKQTIFDHFKLLIPQLSETFGELEIIIRPHPVENKRPYEELASQHKNIKVVQRGNVIPWLRAAKAIVHSGCTTGIEAYLSERPAVSYAPLADKRFGYDAQLPDQLSYGCVTAAEVVATIENIIAGQQPALTSTALKDYVDFHQDTLCCTKIIEILQKINSDAKNNKQRHNPIHGWLLANKRRLVKRVKSCSPHSKYNKSFQEARFPTLDASELTYKINAFSKVLGIDSPPIIKPISPHIFLVQ